MQPKKVPLRKCIGCGEMKPKRELTRIVRSPGRGAYLCPRAECLRLARKAKRLERAFACAIPAEVYDTMEEALGKGDG